METEKMKLSEILLKYIDFLDNPSEEKNQEILLMLSHITVRQYLPLNEKIKAAIAVIDCAKIVDETALNMAINIEIGKLVLGLISGYCLNIENDLNIATMQMGIYDLLYNTGFVDYILDKGAERDYQRFSKLVDDTLNFSNIINLLNAFAAFDTDNIQEFYDSIDALKKDITPEQIEFLKMAVAKGDTSISRVEQALAQQVLQDSLGKTPKDDKDRGVAEYTQDVENSKNSEQEETNEKNTENIVA